MNKLKNDVFTSFLSKNCNKSFPCESTLRKGYFDKYYKKVLSEIRDALGEHKIWFCIDETTDSARLNMTKVIVEILQAGSIGYSYLLHTDYDNILLLYLMRLLIWKKKMVIQFEIPIQILSTYLVWLINVTTSMDKYKNFIKIMISL